MSPTAAEALEALTRLRFAHMAANNPVGSELVATLRAFIESAWADSEREWRKAVMEAYGHLWNINTEPGAPIPLVSPEQAATKARRCLLSLLTKEEQGAAIRAALGPGFFLEGGPR